MIDGRAVTPRLRGRSRSTTGAGCFPMRRRPARRIVFVSRRDRDQRGDVSPPAGLRDAGHAADVQRRRRSSRSTPPGNTTAAGRIWGRRGIRRIMSWMARTGDRDRRLLGVETDVVPGPIRTHRLTTPRIRPTHHHVLLPDRIQCGRGPDRRAAPDAAHHRRWGDFLSQRRRVDADRRAGCRGI